MSGRPHTVLDIVERLDRETGRTRVTVDDLVRAFGASAFLPIMMVPALLVVSPLSGIPLFSSACGLTVALVAAQMIFGRQNLWLPPVIRQRQISGARLHGGMRRLRGLADWIDRHTRDRLMVLVGPAAHTAVLGGCLVCGLAMPFLEIVPFSSSILGLAILCFCTGLLAADGLLVLAGLVLMAAALSVPVAITLGLVATL